MSTNFTSEVKDLGDSLDEVDLKRREAQITQAAKNEALREFKAAYSAAIRLLEAMTILAGKPELAERVRPTSRRRSSGSDAESAEKAPDADSTTEAENSIESTYSA